MNRSELESELQSLIEESRQDIPKWIDLGAYFYRLGKEKPGCVFSEKIKLSRMTGFQATSFWQAVRSPKTNPRRLKRMVAQIVSQREHLEARLAFAENAADFQDASAVMTFALLPSMAMASGRPAVRQIIHTWCHQVRKHPRLWESGQHVGLAAYLPALALAILRDPSLFVSKG